MTRGPEQRLPNYYAALGLLQDADDAAIKKAYRGLAKDLHPDKNPDPQARERFVEVSKAYDVLSDPRERSFYDTEWKFEQRTRSTQTAERPYAATQSTARPEQYQTSSSTSTNSRESGTQT